jgi:hypothetical protein
MHALRSFGTAIVVFTGFASAMAASGGTGSQRVDDYDRSPVAEPGWVSHVVRGSPRVDDFRTAPAVRTWVNHIQLGSPRVDDFEATPAR